MNAKTRRVLVIGGSGFIGTHLCRKLLSQGILPVVYDRVAPSVAGVEYHRGDMSSVADLWPTLLEEVEAVYHLAWTTKPQSANDDPLYDLQSNVVGSLHLLDGIARLKRQPRLIFISTGGAVYGQAGDAPIAEDFPALPLNAYGISKLTFEHYLRLYNRLHGLDYLVFRPGNPYGEGQDPAGAQGAVAVFLGRIVRDEEITIWGDGSVVRDYLHIDDLIAALVAGLSFQPAATGPRIFNVGSGQGVSLNELIRLLEKASGKKARVTYTPSRKADVPAVVLDIARIRQHLGWSPRITLEQGLRRTWEWIAASRRGAV